MSCVPPSLSERRPSERDVSRREKKERSDIVLWFVGGVIAMFVGDR